MMRNAFAQFEIILSNFDDSDQFSIRFNVFDRPIARRWLSALSLLLKQGNEMLKDYCFLGFPENQKNLEVLCQRLNYHIGMINAFFHGEDGHLKYHIGKHYIPDMFFRDGKMIQPALNELHQHFEKLIGQVWAPSVYVTSADRKTAQSILHLNHLCHQIEMLSRSKQMFLANPDKVGALIQVGFANAINFNLHPEDYDDFSLKTGIGSVFLKYSQWGKTHLEAFCDKDEFIDWSNISGLRYVTGEFFVDWCLIDEAETVELQKNLHQWLRSHGVDPNQKELALGRCQVAELAPNQFEGMRVSEIQKKLSSYSEIKSISVYQNSRVIKKNFLKQEINYSGSSKYVYPDNPSS